jgi:hypothetical protein
MDSSRHDKSDLARTPSDRSIKREPSFSERIAKDKERERQAAGGGKELPEPPTRREEQLQQRIEELEKELKKKKPTERGFVDKIKYNTLQRNDRFFRNRMPETQKLEWMVEEHEMRARHARQQLNAINEGGSDRQSIKNKHRREKEKMYERHAEQYRKMRDEQLGRLAPNTTLS